MRRPVLLDSDAPSAAWLDALADLARRTAAVEGSVDAALGLLAPAETLVPLPGTGTTMRLWELLATLGAADLTAARVVEPHLDALAILAQAGLDHPGSAGSAGASWGVYAAEGSGLRLDARAEGGGWRLAGTKPWCSLAAELDRAVVTAHTGPGTRRAFAVDLRHAGVRPGRGTWASRGLTAVDSTAVEFTDVPAVPVGGDNWYLQRSGFAWGGIGVAAVWFGGAVGVARRLAAAARNREPDQIALMLLGQTDTALHGARRVLAAAAADVDAGRADGPDGALLAGQVRAVVADAAEQVLRLAGHGLGPGPLTGEEEYARRVADLQVYLRQHHAERDSAALGRALLTAGGEPW
ncbi:acyl-CoA dehydrogenase [Arthrobacter sp. YD2]|uniref:acyl-CoA dehydrogenase n=1 Tax=Arthrobacter sp. YD2 TaxID=3058046 RepID=UPI0025B4822F|nr:acyl-CoA dehydrogenase [Arthrobacter sp. YD2]MDN3905865.1 acyl-CoA dehydrogenase [Arthrobacter sp. YD2]